LVCRKKFAVIVTPFQAPCKPAAYANICSCRRGSPYAHFRRAIERRHLLSAETAALELPQPLNLGDALALLLLIAEFDPDRYSRAAARWHGRFVVECGVSLEDATLALAALTSIGSSDAALNVLAELAARYRVANIGAALRRFRIASNSSG
jgi:hypothetical protein